MSKKKKRRHKVEDEGEVVQGTLRLHPRGFGFVQPELPSLFDQDIFIPKKFTKNGVDGDKVEVVVNSRVTSEKGPEGKIVAILHRTRTHIAGVISWIKRGEIAAYVPLLGEAQRVIVKDSGDPPVRVGDRVVMEVLDWGEKETETVCRVSHHLGHISIPSADIPAAIEEFSLRSDFPTAAIQQAKDYGSKVTLAEIKTRHDFRTLETFTIDPDTAKDFDDALSLRKDPDGHYHLVVHIADVSHYVKPGTPLDEEAKERANSTYFPGKCIPMLPAELSNELCSLRPQVNRLTISVMMEFDPSGNLLNHEIVRGVIKSQKRFTYKEAKAVLDGKKQSPHLPTLNLMVELTHILKKKRHARGNIEFALPESVVKVNDDGFPTGTECVAYDITHQLVEEFMLQANELVATTLTNQGKLLTYRIHEAPQDDNIKDFVELARAFSFNLPDKPSPHDMQKFFEEVMDTSYGPYLAQAYIRKMRLAMYSPENIGHFGLALDHYCHFTSPIRRYADLVVHRILFGEEISKEQLTAISKRCSDQERLSAKAEMNVVLLKKLRLLEQQQKENPNAQYEAVVTKIKPFGIFFEINTLMIEGFLHVSELEDDYYVYDHSKGKLLGDRFRTSFHAGDKIVVMVNTVDLIYLDTSWDFVQRL